MEEAVFTRVIVIIIILLFISAFVGLFRLLQRNRKVLICDLDGTLIVTKSNKTFPVNKDDWKFKPGINYAIRSYNPRYIFIISNQGGITKGYISRVDFEEKLHNIIDEIRTWGDFIVDGTYCSSNDKLNPRRKPNIGMILDFKHSYLSGYDFNNKDALMIGDASGLPGQFSDSDLRCAANAGIDYCDVDKFIQAADPCSSCLDSACCTEEYSPNLPCLLDYQQRLKKVVIKH